MKKLLILIAILFLATPVFAKKYRLETDFAFADRKDAIAILNQLEKIKKKAAKPFESPFGINLRIPRQVRFHECKHDDTPPTQCGDYEFVDFDGLEKVWE